MNKESTTSIPPPLPGSSTIDQLERILDVCGKPDGNAIAGMKSTFAEKMIETRVEAGVTLQAASRAHRLKRLTEIIRGATEKPIDNAVIEMVCDMLDIDPVTRMTVEQAIERCHKRLSVR